MNKNVTNTFSLIGILILRLIIQKKNSRFESLVNGRNQSDSLYLWLPDVNINYEIRIMCACDSTKNRITCVILVNVSDARSATPNFFALHYVRGVVTTL